jgi:hypothetical protein
VRRLLSCTFLSSVFEGDAPKERYLSFAGPLQFDFQK